MAPRVHSSSVATCSRALANVAFPRRKTTGIVVALFLIMLNMTKIAAIADKITSYRSRRRWSRFARACDAHIALVRMSREVRYTEQDLAWFCRPVES